MAYTTIKKPSSYFNTKLYTGNGTGQSITGVNFQPDFVWCKRRNITGQHFLQNIVQGTNKALFSDSTAAEFTGGVDGGTSVTSFDSDGFTLGTEGGINGSGGTFVSWNWLASNTTASNTDGEQSATVSANTTSGFSIIKWTGNGSLAKSTVGHGLGVTPNVFITKRTNSTSSWIVYHSAMDTTGDYYLNLENTGAKASYTEVFGDGMTSSVCGLATFHTDGDYVGYAFAEKKGFSKFGSYTGNGNADGTFVYTGFKPAFILIKKTSGVASWYINDNKRSSSGGFNVSNEYLRANFSAATGTDQNGGDFVSNGFKLRNADTDYNASGATYIYMAFAEEPLVGDNPATAR